MLSLSETSKAIRDKVDAIDIKEFLGSNELILLSHLHNEGDAAYPLVFRKVSELAEDFENSDEVIYLSLRVYEYLSNQVYPTKAFRLAILDEDGFARVRIRSNNIKDLQQASTPSETRIISYSLGFEFEAQVRVAQAKILFKNVKNFFTKSTPSS